LRAAMWVVQRDARRVDSKESDLVAPRAGM